jgi:hypothetical protein
VINCLTAHPSGNFGSLNQLSKPAPLDCGFP